MADVPAQLSWSSFPFCQLATATGRGPTSHPYAVLDVNFRHYGRTVHEYMLLGWERSGNVADALRILLTRGHKVKSVNFTLPVPLGLPTRPGPTEWRIPGDWQEPRLGTGKTAQTVRRACRGLLTTRSVPGDPFTHCILEEWAKWAANRHYMVFRGVYRRWLVMWDERCMVGSPWLYQVVQEDGGVLGIFGGEIDKATGEAVVTLAKHLPQLDGKALWCLGLKSLMEEYNPSMVHCGADADELKRGLGMLAHRSWVPDLKALS
jgi:hypothetical protein